MDNKNQAIDWIKGGILFIITAIVPFIVKMVQLHPRDDEYGVVRAQWDVADAFSYYKMSVIMILAVLLAVYALTDMWGRQPKKAIKKPENFIPLAFLILCFLSALVSPHKTVAFYGASERFEGFWMWAAYMLLFIEARVFIEDRRCLAVLTAAFCVGAFLVGTVGFLQLIGKNPYESETVARLVMGDIKGGFTMRFSSVFSTLYNPNCVGIFTGMLCPFFLTAGIAAPIKKWYKYVFLVLFALMLANLFGCESVGGFLGIAAGLGFAALAAALYFVKKTGKKGLIAAVAVLGCLAAAAVIILSGNNKIAEKVDVIRQTVKNPASAESPFFFKKIAIGGQNGHTAIITTQTGDIEITVEDGNKKIEFTADGVTQNVPLVPAVPESGFAEAYTCNIPGLVTSALSMTENGFMQFKGGDGQKSFTSFYFDISDGDLVFTDMFSSPIDLDKKYPSVGFEGMERLGSNRGYIWSRSIPLLSKNILIGAGPDCYVFEFPQKDVLSKLEILGNPNVIIDKPHSFYLQVAINTGLVSLLLLIALFAVYIVNTLRAVLKSTDNMLTGLRIGAAAGVIGYLATVTTTDSVVCVSPLFWVLLGLGFAVNKLPDVEDQR